MKSLELLEKINKQIYWKKNVGDYPCFTLNELKELKQYLEVLEIIRKKNVNINRLKTVIRLVKGGLFKIEEALKHYNLHEDNLTLKELQKIKQWLEENEDDNKSL